MNANTVSMYWTLYWGLCLWEKPRPTSDHINIQQVTTARGTPQYNTCVAAIFSSLPSPQEKVTPNEPWPSTSHICGGQL